MELRHLRYFVAVAEAGSVVNAARALHVAQPALSRQIQALERLVGVTLFDRLPHGVRLTKAGKAFRAEAKRALAAAGRAVVRARHGGDVQHERLRIGYGELLAYWPLIAGLFQRFRTAHPIVDMAATQMPGSQLPAALRDGRIDVAIVAVPKWPVRGLDGLRLVDATQTGALLPANHPIAATATITFTDLASLTWYHLPAEATLGCYEAALAWMRKQGMRMPPRTARAGGFGGLPQVAAGNAFAFADETLGNAIAAQTPSIVFRPFREDPVPVWLALLWKRKPRAKPLLDFIELARKSARRR